MRLFIAILMLGCLQAHVVTPEVFAEMQKRLKKNAQDVEAIIVCSHYYENKNEYAESISHIKKAIAIMGQQPSTLPNLYIRMAQMYVNTEQYSEAIKTFNKLLTEEFCQNYGHVPPIQHAILWRGKVYAALGKNIKAWKDVQFVLEREKEMPAYFVEAAKIAEKLNKKIEAFDLYAEAATKFPTPESEPSVVKAIRLIIASQPQKALNLLQKLENILQNPKEEIHHPYPSFYIAMIAQNYLKDKELKDQKLARVAKIIEKNTDKSTQFFWKARIALFQKKYPQALEYINKSIAADKRPAAVYQLRASIYEAQKNDVAVKENLQKYTETKNKYSYQWLFFYEIK
ncbi:tetratricopeptide repeat protein [Candidatus Uabimicrobium sp. HlEnr_7]|uniref:tetratricopeptide repeat protein n=1 Tax=Candidatus Uabimicrobium helgolandensis TaxID=3095367 RepID=UPI0035569265